MVLKNYYQIGLKICIYYNAKMYEFIRETLFSNLI